MQRETSCIVCGATADRVIRRPNGYDLHLCSCGGVYISPMPGPDEVDPTVDGHSEAFYEAFAKMQVDWLAQTHPSGRLLEVGCGEGAFLEAAQAHGYEVAGIEADPERAARTAERLGIDVECALVEESNWSPGSFDIVYHCDMLSHFPDPRLALGRMSRLLRPGGVLFFRLALVGGLAPLWYRLQYMDDGPEHRWFYSERALRRLLTGCELEVQRVRREGLALEALVYQTARRVRRVVGGRRRAPVAADGARADVQERAWWVRAERIMRTVSTLLLPGVGPQGVLMIAGPRATVVAQARIELATP